MPPLLYRHTNVSKEHLSLLEEHILNILLIYQTQTKDEVIEMLDNCIHAKYGALPAVVKVTVLTFQRSPSSMCHYLVLTGHPQINETSGYCAEIFVVCKEAAHRDWNDVVLNADKCGVLCEIDSNKSINVRFLDGKHSDLAEQSLSVIGGSSLVTIE